MARWLVIWIALGCFAQQLAGQQPPNVIVVLFNGSIWGDRSNPASDTAEVAALDQLLGESVDFKQFYTQSSAACTYASLLTGRYALRTGVRGEDQRKEVLPSDEVTLAEIFKSVGYTTGFFGQWLNGAQFPNDPRGQGFDVFQGGGWGTPVEDGNIPLAVEAGCAPDIQEQVTGEALRFIRHAADGPFFCMLSFPKTSGKENLSPVVTVGHIMDVLDSAQIREQTLLVLLGADRLSQAFGYLASATFGGAIHISCRVHWSNYLPARTMPNPARDIDLAPTLAGLCGISIPDSLEIDGIYLNALMQGAPDRTGDRPLFFQESQQTQGASYPGLVLWKNYALAVQAKEQPELYDFRALSGQLQDIQEQYPEIVREMESAYRDWYSDVSGRKKPLVPVAVALPGHPEVWIRATDCLQFTGAIRFEGCSCCPGSWLAGFSNVRDTIFWEIDVHTPGLYALDLRYSIAPVSAGGLLQFRSGVASLAFQIPEASEGGLIESVNSYPGQEIPAWKHMQAGVIELGAGKQFLSLALATSRNREAVIAVQALRLYLEKAVPVSNPEKGRRMKKKRSSGGRSGWRK